MAAALLEIEAVRVDKSGDRILDVEHLDVLDGEVLGLLGPNGSGKTTLLRVMNLLEDTSEGRVRYRGTAPEGRAATLATRRKMSMVFQDPMLFNRSVRANVAYGLRARGVAAEELDRRVDEALAKVGVTHLAERPARVLSGGEAQRVALARSIVLEPELLLLDEPLASVDAPSKESLQRDLARLLEEGGLTAVYVTHDRSEILAMADRVAVMAGGSILQVGVPEEVFNHPSSEEVAALVGAETVVPGTLAAWRDGVAVVTTLGGEVEAACPEEGARTGRPVLVAVRPEEVVVSKEGLESRSGATHPSGATYPSSARNRFSGRITGVTDRGYFHRIAIDCGFELVAHVTRPSVRELDLRVGDEVVASFKATAAHLIMR